MADKGAKKYKNKKIRSILSAIMAILFNVLIVFLGIVGVHRSVAKSKINYVFGEEGKKLPKDVNNFRDIPGNKDIYRALWVADTYGLLKDKNDFIGTILLKWIYDGNISVKTETFKKVFGEKKEDVIIFNKEPNSNEHENNLYKYMVEASGDGVLEKDEFKKWCEKHIKSGIIIEGTVELHLKKED